MLANFFGIYTACLDLLTSLSQWPDSLSPVCPSPLASVHHAPLLRAPWLPPGPASDSCGKQGYFHSPIFGLLTSRPPLPLLCCSCSYLLTNTNCKTPGYLFDRCQQIICYMIGPNYLLSDWSKPAVTKKVVSVARC